MPKELIQARIDSDKKAKLVALAEEKQLELSDLIKEAIDLLLNPSPGISSVTTDELDTEIKEAKLRNIKARTGFTLVKTDILLGMLPPETRGRVENYLEAHDLREPDNALEDRQDNEPEEPEEFRKVLGVCRACGDLYSFEQVDDCKRLNHVLSVEVIRKIQP
jgi:hypothetical protein